MQTFVIVVFIASATFTGCISTVERAERDRIDISRQIDDICASPPSERDATIDKLKRETGLVIVCGAVKK